MESQSKKILLFFIFVFFLFPTTHVFGQFADNPNEIPMSLEVTPEHPAPRQSVSLKVISYFADLDNSTFTWYVNNSRASTGKGTKTFSTTVGDAGSITTVSVAVVAPDGTTATKSITFRPTRVALMWESSSYVPPFYKGKAQVGPRSRVRVIALPELQGGTSNPDNYIFTWTKDGRIMGDQSGPGKNILQLTSPLHGIPTNVKVTVSSRDSTLKANASLTINSIQPKLVVYQYSPLYGTLYNQAVGDTITLNSQEISFSAIPYFISTDSLTRSPKYTWMMDKNPVTNGNSSVMTLRNDANSTGKAEITVSAGVNALNQTNQRQFLVTY